MPLWPPGPYVSIRGSHDKPDSRSSEQNDLITGFSLAHRPDGRPYVSRHASGPATIPCPTTGRLLRIATLDAEAAAICPSCASQGQGGFVSFVGDLRMAYACPQCCELVWLAGA
jgi:hypothetical protein